MKIQDRNSDGEKSLINAQLNLPYYTNRNNFYANGRVIAIYAKDNSYHDYDYFVLYNCGKIWKRSSYSQMHFMNRGGVIVVFNTTSNKIIYTFDEGKTYYKFPLDNGYKLSYHVTTFGQYGNETLLILGRNQNQSHIIITHVDFKRIFSKHIFKQIERQCERYDYYPWRFTRNGKTCFQGQETVYFEKDLKSMCINNHTESFQINYNCPCYIQDFQWYTIVLF
ncbi:VPS10 domain-containing receptor SorCS1 [Thelohanellus kitauei]|uniref:VPS10 domain-containing receptor SorCS1 n=1 Tax=Thelohanellus kitauei TaxID=669202 RepID=A0A0C2MPL3_THEKT|nr:VPS10 domain-containing receptor SorCS1 [Thelohanellus kitauei]